MKLTRAERLLIGQIVNIKLDTATLKDHIMLESIFKAADPDGIKYPAPSDFVPEEKKELFQKYENKRVGEIEDKEHQKVLQEAMVKFREVESKIWENEDPEDEWADVKLNPEQLAVIQNHYDTDRRPFPRQYHGAIVSLNDKLQNMKKKPSKKKE